MNKEDPDDFNFKSLKISNSVKIKVKEKLNKLFEYGAKDKSISPKRIALNKNFNKLENKQIFSIH